MKITSKSQSYEVQILVDGVKYHKEIRDNNNGCQTLRYEPAFAGNVVFKSAEFNDLNFEAIKNYILEVIHYRSKSNKEAIVAMAFDMDEDQIAKIVESAGEYAEQNDFDIMLEIPVADRKRMWHAQGTSLFGGWRARTQTPMKMIKIIKK